MTLRPVCRMVSLACLFCFPNVLWGLICLLYNYAYILTCGCMCKRRRWKKQFSGVPSLQWSEMGKQNIQAKKVWSITIESILVFLANLCEEFKLQSGGPSSLFVLWAWSQVMRGLKNKSPCLSKKAKPSVILVAVVVKWAHRAKGLLL